MTARAVDVRVVSDTCPIADLRKATLKDAFVWI